MEQQHFIVIRDPRQRRTEPRVLAAFCECGWSGMARIGRNAFGIASADGRAHLEQVAQDSAGETDLAARHGLVV